MPDLSSIQPIAAIISALCAAAGFLVALFITRKYKRVTFWVSNVEDLTKALRGQGGTAHARVIVGDREVGTLSKFTVTAKNTGNSPIPNFSYTAYTPMNATFISIAFDVSSDGVLGATSDWSSADGSGNPTTIKVNLPFFNPKETFTVTYFYDGPPMRVNSVNCRLEDVTVRIKAGEYVPLAKTLQIFTAEHRVTRLVVVIAVASLFFNGIVAFLEPIVKLLLGGR